ncbi:hypothetical protein D3C73_724550 [compost metagenome]
MVPTLAVASADKANVGTKLFTLIPLITSISIVWAITSMMAEPVCSAKPNATISFASFAVTFTEYVVFVIPSVAVTITFLPVVNRIASVIPSSS